jgi:hypothetical protein
LLERKTDGVIAGNVLERGRASYARGAWPDAYELLSRADEEDLLEPDDLELLAGSAYMLGRDDDYVRALERAHHGHLHAGDVPSAARCTWWIGLNLLMRGETARANGWFGRGDRLLEREAHECVARGYLLLAVMLDAFARGDAETAGALAAEAAAIGERFGDRDLATIGLMDEGHALLLQGKTELMKSANGWLSTFGQYSDHSSYMRRPSRTLRREEANEASGAGRRRYSSSSAVHSDCGGAESSARRSSAST